MTRVGVAEGVESLRIRIIIPNLVPHSPSSCPHSWRLSLPWLVAPPAGKKCNVIKREGDTEVTSTH